MIVTPPIAGVTTAASVFGSVQQLGLSRLRVLAQHHGLVAQGLVPPGGDEDRAEIGAFAAAGSRSLGVTGRMPLAPGLSVAALLMTSRADYATAGYGEAIVHETTTIGATLRYVSAPARLRGFVEGGGWLAPDLSLELRRAYANGSGVATGISRPSGDLSYIFGRAGMVLAIAPRTRLTLASEIGRERLSLGGDDETLSNANPFEAHYGRAADRATLGKLQVGVTHDAGRLALAATGGWTRALDYRSDLAVRIPGIGTLGTVMPGSIDWWEYRAAVAYHVTPRARLSAFVSGVAGDEAYSENRTHVGLALNVGL